MINLEEVSIIEADHHKLIISNLSQFYQHDLSPYFDFFPEDFPQERGLYGPLEYFGLYWSEKDRYPFLFICKERPIGFALVNTLASSVIASVMLLFRAARLLNLIALSLFMDGISSIIFIFSIHAIRNTTYVANQLLS